MKKATLLAAACALFVGAQSLAAQEPAEGVTYVSDPSQGYLVNGMTDNWFITVEGGANVDLGSWGRVQDFTDRIAPAASIYAGKWFSPVFGGRFGVNWTQFKGIATGPDFLGATNDKVGRFYKMKTNEIGPVFDLMINLTNWWCGYKPGRVYNATLYVGAGGYASLDGDWNDGKDWITAVRAGLINSFNLSEQVALNLDLRWTGHDALLNGTHGNGTNHNLAAFLGLTYKFKDREWAAPVVPVYPEPENCDPLRERLRAANDRIDQLEAALRDCQNRPVETIVTKVGPLATVYYPIGVSRLSRENKRVVVAIANQMNSDEYAGKKFNLTGWADNYTGTEAINARLRAKRAEGVVNVLVQNGVDASRLNVVENNGNRVAGEESVSLSRAVTIEEAE